MAVCVSGHNFYALARTFGGLALEYKDLIESDFAAASGAAYSPPETTGIFRRINVARAIQLLGDCPVVVETFQTSAASLYLPANTTSDLTNDAGDGRMFMFKNSGTGNISIYDWTGTLLITLRPGIIIICFGNANDTWDFPFQAVNISFDNATNGFTASNVQAAIEEAKQNAEGFPRAGLPLIMNGTVGSGDWIRYSELLSNPRILFPVKVRIKEITWVNSNTSLGAFDFEFYLNGQAAGNKVFTYTAPAADRTAGYGYYVWTANLDFAAGDSLYIKYVKPAGTSLSDLALIVWIARIP